MSTNAIVNRTALDAPAAIDPALNRIQRRILKAYRESGGTLADAPCRNQLAVFVREEIILLGPCTRRALELTLEGGSRGTHEAIADRLAAEEGRPVSALSVRKRVSRGARKLELAIRRHRWEPPASPAYAGDALPPPDAGETVPPPCALAG